MSIKYHAGLPPPSWVPGQRGTPFPEWVPSAGGGKLHNRGHIADSAVTLRLPIVQKCPAELTPWYN
jgi:hypothetical protein